MVRVNVVAEELVMKNKRPQPSMREDPRYADDIPVSANGRVQKVKKVTIKDQGISRKTGKPVDRSRKVWRVFVEFHNLDQAKTVYQQLKEDLPKGFIDVNLYSESLFVSVDLEMRSKRGVSFYTEESAKDAVVAAINRLGFVVENMEDKGLTPFPDEA